jgi:hypothetical protein
MNSTLSTTPGRHDHPPQPVHHELEHARPARRVGALDRLALHVGIALITWGRRPLASESRERLASRHEQRLARAARELQAERMLRLTIPPR